MVSPVTKCFEMELGVKSKYSILIFSRKVARKKGKKKKLPRVRPNSKRFAHPPAPQE